MSEHLLLSPENARRLQSCIHCGLCLTSCPTYLITGKEAESPRGRLVLMDSLDRQVWDDTSAHFRHLDGCLGCRACETACPSGVPYGDLLEQVRARQREHYQPLPFRYRVALAWTTSQRRLKWLTSLLRQLQKLRIDRLVIALRLLPAALRVQLAGLPPLPAGSFSKAAEEHFAPAHPAGTRRGQVALFTGCVMDSWYAEVHAATVRVLRWNGYGVTVPAGQVCCGALHSHAGEEQAGARLLEANRAAFGAVDAQAVVVNSAGCGAQLQKLANGDAALEIVDVTVWLDRQGLVPPVSPLPGRTAYDAPCHLRHAQRIEAEPVRLLALACTELVPLEEAELCCGSAGLYSLGQPEYSRQLLARKLERISTAAPDRLVTANPGCQMQLQGGLRNAGSDLPVAHIMTVLDAAYSREPGYRTAVMA